MDIIFLTNNEANSDSNFERARDVLKKNIIKIDGSDAGSIKNAYKKILSHVNTDMFLMIEADNYLLSNSTEILQHTEPTKYHARNKFNIEYEHGCLKILDAAYLEYQLNNNPVIHENFEVTACLGLRTTPVVYSEHRFEWSEKNEWTTIAKELTKLYFWNDDRLLRQWLEHELPTRIYEELKPYWEKLSMSELFETFLPSLKDIYGRNS